MDAGSRKVFIEVSKQSLDTAAHLLPEVRGLFICSPNCLATEFILNPFLFFFMNSSYGVRHPRQHRLDAVF